MTIAEIEKLQFTFICAAVSLQEPNKSSVSMNKEQLDYLIHLMRSHIIWKKWLVPDE